ncbi:hypothetical protein HRR80_003538 [Exophiala dermatitidis]|uniref:S-adenosyl-L-methionine-dependent methyltransferase n=1 Tax=Exophiala dermatitidis TaxID=5970 RepID=A0AAN6EVK1_EXODE|nr:hypothetical protein HRR76_004660 [Exophiala dermatitidis]KAJ4555770.1 hypothetical protein HRR77_001694 [Exophiala dermatitidis]KAJ4556103.1 hypothetical protein HRR78_001761 [Exophiala dermatitidis]KAJ4571911.1 hypothetical protein HRR79_003122 [Exophiala dermatitidis]KAJ4586740.1 hypothetical protein HRR82_002351 [Exophiala dermatitidis]
MAESSHLPSDTNQAQAQAQAFTEANRAHWNQSASSYTAEPWQRDMMNKITAFIQQHIEWIGVDFVDPGHEFEAATQGKNKKVRVLDYACGPGSVTYALGARATEYVGIDLSENMVREYNSRFGVSSSSSSADEQRIQDKTAEGIAGPGSGSDSNPFTAHAVVGNLLDPADPAPAHLSSPEFYNFDLVVVGLGFHHFQDIPLATRRLVERLRPGGVFLIIDFVTHAMENPDALPALRTVAHNGFSEDELRKYFEDAGLQDFGLVRMHEEVLLRGTIKREPFMAHGRKV